MHILPEKFSQVYFEEGVDGIIVTFQEQERMINFINGLGHGHRPGYAFYDIAVETASFTPDIKNVLIIGYGTGSITEAILRMEGVERITVVEISGALIKNLSKIPLFKNMMADKRLNMVIDDGRRFLLRTQEKFDLILMDPLRTTTAYSNNIYSHEFYVIVNDHLNSNGVFMVCLIDEFKVNPKTVLSVFKYVKQYLLFCVASQKPLVKSLDKQEKILNQYSLKEKKGMVRMSWVGEYIGDETYIKKATENYPINEDWKPVCEYYIGLRIKNKFTLIN